MEPLSLTTAPPRGFPSLDQDNYVHWSIQMESTLRAMDLWSKSVGAAELKDVSPAVDSKAKAVILLHIATHHLVAAYACTSSRQLWDHLARICQAAGKASRNQLMRELFTVAMTPSESVAQYSARTFNIANSLERIGKKLDPEDFIVPLLNGLSPAFSTIRTILLNQDSDFTFDDVRAKLVGEEKRLMSGEDIESRQQHAFYSRHQQQQQYQQQYCDFCQRFGHSTQDCRQKKRHDADPKYQQHQQHQQQWQPTEVAQLATIEFR